MLIKQPLIQRIIVAFVLMTFVVGGVFSVSIVGIVHYVEEQLVSKSLNETLDFAIQRYEETGREIGLNPHLQFFQSSSEYGIPQPYVAEKIGFSEIINQDGAFYIIKRIVGDTEYLIVEDQSDFEEREAALYRAVFAGFLLSLLAALVVGGNLAKRVISPVLRLAQQVGKLDEQAGLARSLADDYADDEVGALAKAFDRSVGQLSSALVRERLFTSDVSHELRTPLMVIASSCEMMLTSNRLTSGQRQQIARIQYAAQEMADLVQTFLALARAGSTESSMGSSVTLKKATEKQRECWSGAFAAKGLEFVVRGKPDDSRYYNAIFLSTVMSNLLRNALNYTQRGLVCLTLTEDGFMVEDTGTGFSVGESKVLFQPFVRGEDATGAGLGLGLSLVNRICEREGWQMQVGSTALGGSQFYIKLIS